MRPLVFAGLLWVLAGCGNGPSASEFLYVPEGTLRTSGTVIEDAQGRFRLVAGRPFRTPFWSHDCPARPTSRNYALGQRLGAQPVRVYHPSGNLHGLLAFCRVGPEANPPAQRSYSVQVPASYIAETDDGRVSVVYEPSGQTRQYEQENVDLPAWILWLSQRPFQ